MHNRFHESRARRLHESIVTEANSEVHARYHVYSDYNKLLRTWMVAYGVGGPIILATNDTIHYVFSWYKYANIIVWLFLVGVLFQVIVAFINKWAAWQIYVGEYDGDHQASRLFKIWDWINDQQWIDFSADLISFCTLLTATVWTVVAISSPT